MSVLKRPKDLAERSPDQLGTGGPNLHCHSVESVHLLLIQGYFMLWSLHCPSSGAIELSAKFSFDPVGQLARLLEYLDYRLENFPTQDAVLLAKAKRAGLKPKKLVLIQQNLHLALVEMRFLSVGHVGRFPGCEGYWSGGGLSRRNWPDLIGFNCSVIHQRDGYGPVRAMHLGYGALLNTQSLGEIALGAMS
jgi:hypothetical protein